MRIVLPVAAVLAITVYALVDCLLAGRGVVRRRWAWLLGILLLPLVGPALWFVVGRPRRRPPTATSGPDARPLAPDDDPDFLRRIDPPEDADRP
jgi:hypothetical protein